MGFNEKRQEELSKKDMFESTRGKDAKQKPKKSYKDLSIILDYDEKMNMLAPGSILSKIIGIMVVLGVVLYFFNIYIGFWIAVAGFVMYFLFWLVQTIKSKKAKKEAEREKE